VRRLDRHVSRLCAWHRRRKASRGSNQKALLRPHGTLLCCSERPRTTIGRCTLRTVLPATPFRPYVSQKPHFIQFSIIHLDDRRYLNACSDVDECAERLYLYIL